MRTIALSLDFGTQIYRELGQVDTSKPTFVLLHGISSGSGSWLSLADCLEGFHVLAWDAPGYGSTRDVYSEQPLASDYAECLEKWLDALNLGNIILVGHSLGALMATAYASRYPDRVRGLILADPAQGYRHASADEREQVYRSRWPELERLGPENYALKRAPRLLHPEATPHSLAQVREQIQRLNIEGFRRANWMLANDALKDYLPLPSRLPGLVICGAEDAITPPAGVQSLAEHLGWPYRELSRAGHASYIDNPKGFAAVLREFVDRVMSGSPVC